MRLIDSTVLIDKLPIVDKDKQISLIGAVADMVCMISDCPTIDAVPVVRCKDCQYARPTIDGRWMCGATTNPNWVSEDHFCSYGEPKTET